MLPPCSSAAALLAFECGGMGEAAIEIEHLKKHYGRFEALGDVALRVPSGSVFGLLGPNGAGKSTLVKSLLTIIRPNLCTGTLLGMPIGHRPTLGRVGYLPEHARFPEYLTGRQAVMYSAGLAKVPRAKALSLTAALLERTGMSAAANRKIGTYSKGMKQRIGLAQALVNDPELLILDEPTDGVDPEGRIEIRRLVKEMREEGRTVFLNSHLLGEMETMADEVAILAKGRVMVSGNLAEMMAEGRKFEICTQGPVPAQTREELEKAGHQVGGDRIELAIHEMKEVQRVIDRLRAESCEIRRVAEVTRSLEDIFLKTLGEDAKGGAR